MIDRTRVVGDLLFATHGDRCFYLGKSARDQLRWLEENPGRWRRIEDVRQEDAPSRAPVEAEIDLGAGPAEPNGQTSSHDVRKDGGEQSDVTLVDAPAGDSSPPYRPTSLPVRVPAIIKGTTKAELPHGVTAAMGETKEPKTETNPLGAIGRKRGRSGGRQLKKQKPPAGISKAGSKLSPERMRIVLNSLRKTPILWHAAGNAGIHRRTLEYWIKCSAAGDAEYDITWQGVRWRFHEHCKSAIDEAHQKLEDEMLQRALGYDKVLTYRGHVMYKIDQGLVGLGYQGPDAYLKDENGNPVPETVRKADKKAMRFILERYRPEWGKHPKIDAPHEGGVLVIGDVTKKPEYNTTASVKARKWKSWSRKIRETKA
jgi:hypothetical protein